MSTEKHKYFEHLSPHTTVEGVMALLTPTVLQRRETLHVNGEPISTLLVKDNTSQFGVYFDPTHQQWLKVANSLGLNRRLALSCDAMKSSLEFSCGEPDEVFITEVEIEGKGLRHALRMPHFGVSLDNLIRHRLVSKRETDAIYNTAYLYAMALVRRGFMFSDPNPGNILLHNGTGKGIVLIDFTNTHINCIPVQSCYDYVTRGFVDQSHKHGLTFDEEIAALSRQTVLLSSDKI